MARGGSRTIAITWAMLVAAIGACIGLVVVLKAMNPGDGKPQGPPPPAYAPPPVNAPKASVSAGPLTFRDPDSVK